MLLYSANHMSALEQSRATSLALGYYKLIIWRNGHTGQSRITPGIWRVAVTGACGWFSRQQNEVAFKFWCPSRGTT